MDKTWINRRESVRHAEPFGSASCRVGDTAWHYHIRDASTSGVALAGPTIALGTSVDVELHWPSIGKASGRAIVSRQGHAEENFALHFTHTAGVGELMSKLATVEQQRLDDPRPLFCGEGKALKRALAELRSEGVRCEVASSPLEALRQLQDPWLPITSIVLSPTMPWIELSVHVGTEHPSLRRIILHEPQSGADSRLAIEHSWVDMALHEPWQVKQVYQALGLALSN